MECKHIDNDFAHKCFAPANGWTKPCSDCPVKEEAQKFIDASKDVIDNANKFLKKHGIE